MSGLVDPSIIINWMSPSPIQGVSGVLIFYFWQKYLWANSDDPDQKLRFAVGAGSTLFT